MCMAIAKITQITIEEATVPKLIPPFALGLVRKSPNVAPNGLVKTNATQNSNMLEIFVKKCNRATMTSITDIRIALFINPSPMLSAKKSPAAVPSVFAIKKAIQ